MDTFLDEILAERGLSAGCAGSVPDKPCRCRECREESELESLLGEEEFETPVSNTPKPGSFYQIQYGKGGLLTTVGKAYGVDEGAERLKLAQMVNNHPLNRKFWIKPESSFDKKYFPEGVISFSPRFSCGEPQQLAKSGEKRCFGRVWIPDSPGPVDPFSPPPTPFDPNSVDPDPPPLIKIVRCDGRTENTSKHQINRAIVLHWQEAVRRVDVAVKRFEKLESMPVSNRTLEWNNGPESIWFGKYEKGARKTPFKYVMKKIVLIRQVLTDKKNLAFFCDMGEKKSYGFSYPSSPFNYLNPQSYNPKMPKDGWRIFLGLPWIVAQNDISSKEWKETRTGTIIHEAAHYAGANRLLWEYYRKIKAKRLAKRNAWGARVNAGNYEYYIMSL